MPGLDHTLVQLAGGQALLVVLAVALLLGLRHATDPDHLAAVSTLIASDPADGSRRAGRLGLAWGLGHATTLCAFGAPIVLAGSYLPPLVQRGAEVAVGLVIGGLAVRLLLRWRRGHLHGQVHRHGLLGRSRAQAFAIGLVHGMGGSAGLGVLLLAGIPNKTEAGAALAAFAFAAAASMALLSSGLGYALTRGPLLRRTVTLAPGFGCAALAFGLWYSLAALSAVPYPL